MPSSRGEDQVPVHFYVHKTIKADFAEAVQRNGETMTDAFEAFMRNYPQQPKRGSGGVTKVAIRAFEEYLK